MGFLNSTTNDDGAGTFAFIYIMIAILTFVSFIIFG